MDFPYQNTLILEKMASLTRILQDNTLLDCWMHQRNILKYGTLFQGLSPQGLGPPPKCHTINPEGCKMIDRVGMTFLNY